MRCHPEDSSTAFLSAIYDKKCWDVINDPFINQEQIVSLIEAHDRIICLGHGSPFGLFGGFEFLIHDGIATLLRQKEMVSIWCHADQFMRVHKLVGFFSGMFISEAEEASMFDIPYKDKKEIEISNNLFATVLSNCIDSENILEKLLRGYKSMDNSIIKFNRDRLYERRKSFQK